MEKLPQQIRRVIVAEINTRNAELLENTKKIDAQNRVLVSKVHNLQVEVQETNKKLTTLLASLFDIMHQDGPTMNEAQSVIRDFLFNKHKQP